MSIEAEKPEANIQAEDNSVAVGSIQVGGNVGGSIQIGHTIGYTIDQVSALLQQISTTFEPKRFDGRSPYKGLDVFEEEDAELFFGREKIVADLVVRVKESRTLFITGPSGSGKSSLVRAGLMPNLKNGVIKNSNKWFYATIKPGRDPFEALKSAFSRLKSPELGNYLIQNLAKPDVLYECTEAALTERKDQRLVLFVDQFEEVFTQIKDEDRAQLLDLLTNAVNHENCRLIILFSMRSDFVSNCATYPKLNALLNQQFVQIGAMQPDELVSAIAQPALRVGLHIDPDLIAQIINDMQGEPGALPLMQFALKDLFDAQQAQGGIIALTLNDYIQRGGIHKALERHADNSFNKLDQHEQELTRSIFSGLIEIGRGTQDTRRTANFDELIPASAKADEVGAIIRKLADARLITTDEVAGKDTVTISHEKLIDAWPWLKKLLNENRDVIALQNEIAADAKEWEEHQCDSSYLYSGARLVTAREKMEEQTLVLSGLAQDFVEQSIALQEVERKARETLRRRITIGLISGIAIALVLAVFGFYKSGQASTNAMVAQNNLVTAQTAQADAQSQAAAAQANAKAAVTAQANAEAQVKISRAGELAAQAEWLTNSNLQVSLLLGIEAFKLIENDQTYAALLDTSRANSRVLYFLAQHKGSVFSVVFSPDGKTLASGSDDHTIILWDVATGKPLRQPLTGHTDAVNSVAFSPDGKTLASGSEDQTIILWDVAAGKPLGQPLTGHTAGVSSVAFSPDGKTLASSSFDGTIILWDVATGKPLGQPLSAADILYGIAFSPNGKILASAGCESRDEQDSSCSMGTIFLWDVANGKLLGQPFTGGEGAYSVAFSPDGKTLASGNADNTISLWDLATGKPLGLAHLASGDSLAFSPDGKTLASGSFDSTPTLWDVATGQPLGQPLTGHTAGVTSVAFSPDGKTLAVGNDDHTIILWGLATSSEIGQPPAGHPDPESSVTFSPDGKTLAAGSFFDGSIILWDVAASKPLGQPLKGHTAAVSSVAFSPDGKILASGSLDNTIILWDVAAGKPLGQPLAGHTAGVNSVVFSPDGKTLASGSNDSTIILWDVATGKPLGQPLSTTNPVNSVAFSPDGKTLASGDSGNTIILWDVAAGKPLGQPLAEHTDSVSSVVFSPDGKTLASGSEDQTIILWDVAASKPLGQPLTGHTAGVSSVAFSPDGKILASGSLDNTIILWDVVTGKPLGQPLTGPTGGVYSVAFSPDEKTLAAGSFDSTPTLWDVDLQDPIAKSCERAGRNFTRAEWALYFPGETYRATCPQWPLEPEVTAAPTASP